MTRRRVVLIILGGIICVASVVALIDTVPSDIRKVAAIIVAVVGAGAIFDQLWDRFGRGEKKAERASAADAAAAEKAYLKGRLREFDKERERFVKLSGGVELTTEGESVPRGSEKAQQYPDAILAVGDRGFERVVFVGDPGAGKSTSLRHLAAAAMRARLGMVEPHGQKHPLDDLIAKLYPPMRGLGVPLPLWIDMGYSGNPPDAMALLQMWWKRWGLLGNVEDKLRDNDVWLFLDGLNEVPEAKAKRAEYVKSLRELLDKYDPTLLRVVVTCRINDYWLQPERLDGELLENAKPQELDKAEKERRLDLGLPVVRVYPLKSEQIDEFVGKHFAREPAKAAQFVQTLKDDLTLAAFAENPYTLVQLLSIYASKRWAEFLQTEQTQRYNKLFEVYLQQRHEDYKTNKRKKDMTEIVTLEWKPLKRKLGRLAYLMIALGKGTSAEHRWAQRRVGRRVLRDGISLGALVPEQTETGSIIRFYHQSLHGYFALPVLEENLKRRWYEIDWVEQGWQRRANLVIAIATMGEMAVSSVPALITMINDVNVRRTVIAALGYIGSDTAVAALSVAFKDQDKNVRIRAISALGQIRSVAVIPDLINALKDEESGIREYAASALARFGTAAAPAVPYLMDILRDPSPLVYTNVIYALGKIGATAVTPLITMLQNDDGEMRRRAAEAIGQIGVAAISAVPYLLIMLSDEDVSVRISVLSALGPLSSTEALPHLIGALKSTEAYERSIAASALGQSGEIAIAAMSDLLTALEDTTAEVRGGAAFALGQIGSEMAIPKLTIALNDSNWNVRINASEALKRIRSKNAS